MEGVDPTVAVQTFNLVKRYSSRSKSLQSSRRLSNLSQLFSFFVVLAGPKEKQLVALDDVSLRINGGEIFGILGPNGAGKTTFIKILSTLVLPDEGSAYVHGVDVVRRPREALKRLQTALADETGFERRLTGRQNLRLFSELYGVPRDEATRRIDELLALAGVEEFADITYNRYSTGMEKKLQVCRVLLSDAPVLIFDEPTSGLDALAAVEFRKMLLEVLVKQRGKTIIMASHNLWEVQQMCDRIAVLHKGSCIAEGTPTEIRGALNRVSITVDFENANGTALEQIRAGLQHLSGVVNSEISNTDHRGLATLRVEGGREFDYLSFLTLVSSARLKIRSFESTNPSLEDAFIKLTSEPHDT